MQNDSLLPLLYYSFLCNFTSIYVFFLSICKKYIKYALHFLLKLLLTIHLWRMFPDFPHGKARLMFFCTLLPLPNHAYKISAMTAKRASCGSSFCLSRSKAISDRYDLLKNSKFFLISSQRCATHSTERPGSSGVLNT